MATEGASGMSGASSAEPDGSACGITAARLSAITRFADPAAVSRDAAGSVFPAAGGIAASEIGDTAASYGGGSAARKAADAEIACSRAQCEPVSTRSRTRTY